MMASQTKPSSGADGQFGGPLMLDTRLERQLELLLIKSFSGEVVDVLLRPSSPGKGRKNPKVFIVVEKIDVDLYHRITQVALQLTDLAPGAEMNFDIVPGDAVALIPLDALSVKR